MIFSLDSFNNKIKKMKKMWIVVIKSNSAQKICTEDLLRMYYYHKRSLPPLPTYTEPAEKTDTEEFQHEK